jgi:hypothetical protein
MFPSVLHHMTRPLSSRPPRPTPFEGELTIRLAEAHEPAVDQLAELEGQALPAGPSLLAELGGRPIAAIVLSTGAALADPFRPTVAVVELLRVRARQLGPVC